MDIPHHLNLQQQQHQQQQQTNLLLLQQQQQQQQQQQHVIQMPSQLAYPLVLALIKPEEREQALLDLSKKRESFPDLAPLLWHSFGTIAALLTEIVSIYATLSPPSLTAHASNRVCNALALLQCVASHSDTRSLFLNAHIPLYLYPFLNTHSKSRPFEYLRLTSLGVIGALVKTDDETVIHFLLQTEIIPLCLRIMESGSELSKTVATFIVQKVLLDDLGLNYICATAERFYAVSTVLSNMVTSLVEAPSARLLKHIVRCYLRLADNIRAREALRQCLPDALRDRTFEETLRDDPTTRKWLQQLVLIILDEQQHAGNVTAQGRTATLAPQAQMTTDTQPTITNNDHDTDVETETPPSLPKHHHKPTCAKCGFDLPYNLRNHTRPVCKLNQRKKMKLSKT